MRGKIWALGTLLIWSALPAWAGSAAIGKVDSVTGALQIVRGSQTLPAAAGMELRPGDRLINPEGSSATIVLVSDTVRAAVLVKPSSELTLSGGLGQTIDLKLARGRVLSDVHNPKKKPRPFVIRTRVATMGVRGTVFFVRSEDKKPDFLCTCIGEVEVSSTRGGDSLRFKSQHHDVPRTIEAGSGTIASRIRAAEVGEDHVDAEAEELEKVLAKT